MLVTVILIKSYAQNKNPAIRAQTGYPCNPDILRFGFHFGPFAGTEELGHLEMVGTIVHQLTRNLSMEEIEKSGFAPYYVDHTLALWPQAAGGIPQNACEYQSKGDPITDLMEDMAAEQKARTTYDNILRMVKDPDVCDVIKFLRAREVVHFQRFGEALRIVQDKLNAKTFYAFNPEIDTCLVKTEDR